MLPRAPCTEGLVPYLVFLECGGDSKRQYLVEGPSSTGCVPFRGQGGPTLSPPSCSLLCHEESGFAPTTHLLPPPSPECVTEPQSDGAGHGWDCDLKPVTWSLRLWATINLCTLVIPGVCYGNRKPTIQAEPEGEKAWEGREGREREGDSSIFKGVGHRKRISNPHSLDKYTLLGGPGVDPAPYSKQHRYLRYPGTSFLLFYISLCCFCFLSNSRSS